MILVTGGAGYIGSHVVKELGEKGYEVLVYDNLSTGKAERVLFGDLIKGDLNDLRKLEEVFKTYPIEAVMHFAASIKVEESVDDPSSYYQNNLVNTLNLINTMNKYGVQKLIFSSTAAVYGEVNNLTVTEDYNGNPINPYGKSKYMVEHILEDFSNSYALKYVVLRYFNVAGADPEGKLGQDSKGSTHLITRALKTVQGHYEQLEIFGDDYDTADGTCIRDYIHVSDLANAHILSLNYLLNNNTSNTFNVGYNQGYSVKEVLDMVENVTDLNLNRKIVGRRLGDAPVVIAENEKIISTLQWKPKYNNLEMIIKTAWEWETKSLILK